MLTYVVTHGHLETVLNYTLNVFLGTVSGRGETLKLGSFKVLAILSNSSSSHQK